MERARGVGRLLTVREAATRLRLSEPQVYRMVQLRELAGFKIGRSVRVFEDAVEALLAEGWEQATGSPASATSAPGAQTATRTPPRKSAPGARKSPCRG